MKRLPDKVLANGRRQVAFEKEWREGFVGHAVTIELDGERNVRWIEFYDANIGIARWVAGQGLGPTKLWEPPKEPQPHSLPDHAKHFPCTLLGAGSTHGPAPIPDLTGMDERWVSIIQQALARPDADLIVPDDWLVRALKRARRLTDEIPIEEQGWKSWWGRARRILS